MNFKSAQSMAMSSIAFIVIALPVKLILFLLNNNSHSTCTTDFSHEFLVVCKVPNKVFMLK